MQAETLMGEQLREGTVADEPISLVQVYSEFAEFRGETKAHRETIDRRFGDLDRTLHQGLQDIREATLASSGAELRLTVLEAAALPTRLGIVEARWKLAVWLMSAITLASMGAFGALVVAWIQSGG